MDQLDEIQISHGICLQPKSGGLHRTYLEYAFDG